MSDQPNVPVYIFMGLLESGKTSVICDFLESNQFGQNECNLIIMCEEGEEEIDSYILQESNSQLIVLEEEEQLTSSYLNDLQKHYNPSSVLIELNGMWSTSSFMDMEMPSEWFVFQTIGLINAETFEVYQKNMKDRFVDLFRYSEMIILNRCDNNTRQQDIRRNIRVVNRSAQVIFESELDGFVEEPPELPFSLDDDPINIELEDYGTWFVDLQDNPINYDSKRVSFEGYICSAKSNGQEHFATGRVGMACCADDMMFLGIPATGTAFKQLDSAKNERKWGKVVGVIHFKFDKNGEPESMKIKVEGFKESEKPQDPIVYFN